MAKKRSIPTTLFASPDFFELSSNTVRLILIGIILDADDEGRGCAHARLLARKLDQQPADIEQALEELADHGILQCYEAAGRSYYWLCHWHKYQVLSKPTPSSYPEPPRPGKPTSKKAEDSGQGEQEKRSGFTAVDVATPDKNALNEVSMASVGENKRPPAPAQIASVLHLPESPELHEIIQEFASIPTCSVLGEAIEARAWIDDQTRQGRPRQMTPAFFRRWLRRSQRGEETRTSSSQHLSERKSEESAPVAQQTREPDQYEVYVNALMARYSAPEALQEAS